MDALGTGGVEGGMRAGLESTLRVMRGAAELLSTVVGVLQHDPLQQWTLSPKHVRGVLACIDVVIVIIRRTYHNVHSALSMYVV